MREGGWVLGKVAGWEVGREAVWLCGEVEWLGGEGGWLGYMRDTRESSWVPGCTVL